jgi:soluble lytic murein transglycosylase-like protein
MKAVKHIANGLQLLCKDTASGFLYLARSGFTLIGVAIVGSLLALAQYPEIQNLGESRLVEWVHERQDALTSLVRIDNRQTNATDPAELPKQQSALAFWLAKKYGVAPEPLSALIVQAYAIGGSQKLDPLLILAVMGIESGFNPFAQSPVGAQGLMQVMTKIHSDKYERFGGNLAAFDPAANLRVGVFILQDGIKRTGSVEGGLRAYVGATNLAGDGGYVDKVLAEYARLGAVAEGRKVPFNMEPSLPASQQGTTPAMAAVATELADSP